MKLEPLRPIIADIFEIDESALEDDTPFQAQGTYDSLRVVLLMAELEDHLNLTVPPEMAGNLNSIQDIYDYARKEGVDLPSK
tara:strand:- start:21262 stop:21507 length:246 start_codon:yes stop_codon:yes gene_type:complete